MTDATDDFNRANGSLGANWIDSPSLSGLVIASNAVSSVGATWKLAYWNPATNTFANDQHSQVTTGTDIDGAVVRHQSGVSSCYLAFASAGQVFVYRLDSPSTFTLLGSSAVSTVTPGDTLALIATGTSLQAFVNGTSATSIFTDATYASGQPGIAANNGTLDNWAGGPTLAQRP